MSLVSQINALATRIGQEMKLRLKSSNNLSDLSNRQTALNNLANAGGGGDEYVLTKDTVTGNILLKPAAGGGGSNPLISSFELQQDIAANSVVQILEDGRITAVSGEMVPRAIPVVAPDSSMTTDTTSYSCMAMHPTDDSLFAVAYYDATYGSTYLRLGTITGTTISYGTTYTLAAGFNDVACIEWDKVNTNKFVVLYISGSTSGYGYCKIVTKSGSTLSLGAATQISSFGSTFREVFNVSYDPFATDRFVLAVKQDSNGAGIVHVCTVSGTTVTKNTGVVFCTGTSSQSINRIRVMYDPYIANKFVIGYQDTYSQKVAVTVGTISGTSISLGSKYVAASVIPQSVAFSLNMSVANQLIIAWNTYYSTPAYVGFLRVGTISGTAVSFGPTVQYTNTALSVISKVIIDTSGYNRFLITSYNSSGGTYGTTGKITGDTVSLDPELTMNASYLADIRSISNFAITPGRFLYTYDLSNHVNVCIGQLDMSSTNINADQIVGILAESGVVGEVKPVLLSGGVFEGFSGLTTGAKYYLTTAGQLTTVNEPYSVLIGLALSPTKLKTISTLST